MNLLQPDLYHTGTFDISTVDCFRGLVGYDDRLTRDRSPVRSRAEVLFVFTTDTFYQIYGRQNIPVIPPVA